MAKIFLTRKIPEAGIEKLKKAGHEIEAMKKLVGEKLELFGSVNR